MQVDFTFPDFSDSKRLTWQFHIDEDDSDEGVGYDMIIGRDLMNKIGILLDFEEKQIRWEGDSISMRDYYTEIPTRRIPLDKSEIHTVMARHPEPTATAEATARVTKILDAKYEQANLEEIVAKAMRLNSEQKRQL